MSDLAEARKRYRRAWVSFGDFMEAGAALNSSRVIRCEHPHQVEEAATWLIGFAIVAYMRPFKPSWAHPDATRSMTLDELGVHLTATQALFHARIEELRDKVIAHSDFSHKELIPQGFNVAKAVSVPTIMQLKAVDRDQFTVLVGAAIEGVTAYMTRLHAQHGDALHG